MIHLMIVDDEERARSGIRTLIDWAQHDIAIVAEARDGEEALEWMGRVNVDIVLTDIRMPEMDGLELIERISQRYPAVKCVIMSGYDEFSYAQKALSLGASHYLLKPSRRQEILNLVLQLRAEIDRERQQSSRLEELKAGFRDSFQLLRDKMLGRLVLTENPPYDRLLASLKKNGIAFPHPFYGSLVIQIDNFHSFQQRVGDEDVELYKYGLKNIAEETLAPLGTCAVFEHNDDLIALLNAEEMPDSAAIGGYAQQIQRNAETYLKFTVSIGIGSVGAEIGHLRLSYQEAARALDMRFYMGDRKIVDYMESVDGEADHTSYPFALEKAFIQAVMHGEEGAIREQLQAFLQALRPDSASKEPVLNSIFSLFFALYRLCIEKNVNVQEVFGGDLAGITHMLARSSLEGIVQALDETALLVAGQLNAKKNGNKLFDAVTTYIRRNFNKDISRETVAREVYITPGYVSLLFKQQLQTSFLDYLHQTRIDHACRMFEDRSVRIADVAHEVGYQDEKYFFQVFKKYTGMTPNQYRNQMSERS